MKKQESSLSTQNPESTQQMKLLSLNNGKLSVSSSQYSQNLSILSKRQVIQSVEVLLLGWNQNPSIINLLQNPISFNNLKLLTLNGNRIVTIEPLTTLQMPQLIHFELCENNIVSLRSLRKMKIPNLRQLNISGIKVVDRHQLQFSQCLWPNLSALIINLKMGCYKGVVKANFQLDFAVYSNQQAIPRFLFKRFPKTEQNDYDFLDLMTKYF